MAQRGSGLRQLGQLGRLAFCELSQLLLPLLLPDNEFAVRSSSDDMCSERLQ